MNVFYKGKNHEAYLSHVKVQITASRKDIYNMKMERNESGKIWQKVIFKHAIG